VTDVTTSPERDGAVLSAADEQLLRELTERARAGGLKLTGQGGLLGTLTKMVIEGALEGELDDHLGYEKNDPAGRDGRNSRNGHRAKTCSPTPGRWRSPCRGTAIPASSRESSPKGSGG
jgi:putative transposase